MTDSLPTSSLQLRSLVTEAGTLELSLVDVPIPPLGADEVLVRVEAAPINPSDLGLLLAGAAVASAVVSGTATDPSSRRLSQRERFGPWPVGSASLSPLGTRELAPWWPRRPPATRKRYLDGLSRSLGARCIRNTVR